jgi:hypothetical protein
MKPIKIIISVVTFIVRHISIPRSLEAPIAKRLIKEHNLHD